MDRTLEKTFDPNLSLALQMLDNLSDYGASRDLMIGELRFNFGYDEREAKAVYNRWLQMVA